MVRHLAFNFLFLICIGYALIRGGKAERSVAILFCVARIVTDVTLGLAGHHYRGPEYGGVAVDILTFAALVWVALSSDRYWTLVVAAMQGVSLLAHLGRLIEYDIVQTVYLNAVQLWAYPQLLVLLIGTVRVDLRARHIPAGWWPLPRNDTA